MIVAALDTLMPRFETMTTVKTQRGTGVNLSSKQPSRETPGGDRFMHRQMTKQSSKLDLNISRGK
jgi:hypothetical protein